MLGRQRTEISIIAAVLNNSDQKVPWVSGSQPLMPNNSWGRSQEIPNGPPLSQATSNQLAWVSAGNSKV